VLEGLATLPRARPCGAHRAEDPRCAPRICYDHLAGDLGVQMLDPSKQRLVRQTKDAIEPTGEGKRFMAESLQIDADSSPIRAGRCAACLDWSERRHVWPAPWARRS
jgi:hypothetical protein